MLFTFSSLAPVWHSLAPKSLSKEISSWLFQPIWKIWSSNWIISSRIGVKIKNIWNHHPEFELQLFGWNTHNVQSHNLIMRIPSRTAQLPSQLGSWYGIFTYNGSFFMVNVGKYTIHGRWILWDPLPQIIFESMIFPTSHLLGICFLVGIFWVFINQQRNAPWKALTKPWVPEICPIENPKLAPFQLQPRQIWSGLVNDFFLPAASPSLSTLFNETDV